MNEQEWNGKHNDVLKQREKRITNQFGAYGFLFGRKDSAQESQGYLAKKSVVSETAGRTPQPTRTILKLVVSGVGRSQAPAVDMSISQLKLALHPGGAGVGHLP
jgi:hypothetical protein